MLELALIWCILGAMVGVIAHAKGYDGMGWGLYGILLFPVALVHILVKPKSALALAKAELADGRRACPECAESIKVAARICPHCKSALPDGWAAARS